MALHRKLFNYSCSPFLKFFKVQTREIGTSAFFCQKEKAEENFTLADILSELQGSELSEEEILQKRFKARLPEYVYRKFVKKEAVPILNKYDYEMFRLRRYYARHGYASKLNPGICWPTREEILETIQYDKTLEPSLQERLKNVEDARVEKLKKEKAVEDEVDKNMANLDKWVGEYYARIEKKKADVLELKKKREKLVEEISEYLGYEIDPKDPRFQEAVQQRDKERKKELKAKKQQQSYDRMIAKLKQIAQKES